MDKNYQPKNIEQLLYEHWEKMGYFKPKNYDKESYCIMIPPPNITGSLHMGHAFQQTIMDIIIRYQRMQGKNTLWQVGIDHASIATQIMMERKIFSEEGKTSFDYGRKKFIKKIWQWKKETNATINYQMRRLGNSIDWDRERFTMDDEFSNSVKKAFIKLYEDNLIYRGKRLVNWDPKLGTVVSDLEIEKKSLNGYMWYLRYPLVDGVKTCNGLDYIVIATTRPETILGDVGIAVNPLDKRFNNLIGKYTFIPLINQAIPIIGDSFVNINKGTGCMKITPAHDFNDYEISKRHNLPMINIFTFTGKIRRNVEIFDIHGKNDNSFIREIPKKFHNMDRFDARKAIIRECNYAGLLHDTKIHCLNIPYGDRSGVIIEPMLTSQWYIRMLPFKKMAIQVVKQDRIKFLSKKYKNMYLSWMSNVKDWCISRQLWWGHQIPVWYDTAGKIYVGFNEMEIRKKNKLHNNVILFQDEDVLDTWFSSGLWTFATLGWPNNNNMLKIFHPTNVIISGFDIIFFWIARMIFLTMYFIKNEHGNSQIPFNFIYITGLIRDDKGNKMSKSKGNVIDPLDIIDGISLEDLIKKRTSNLIKPQFIKNICQNTKKQFPNGIKAYGADALRFTLMSLASSSRDIKLNIHRLEGYHNFCNKLWHASRFVIIHTKDKDCGFNKDEKIFSLADRWITLKFNEVVNKFRKALDNYRFDIAAYILYDFIWNKFCDWYLELIKPIIFNGNKTEVIGTRYTLINILEAILRLAHPVIPHITEFIWQKVKVIINKHKDSIMLENFPKFNPTKIDTNIINNFNLVKDIITITRVIRVEMNISANKLIPILLRNMSLENQSLIEDNINIISNVGKLDSIKILSKKDNIPPLSYIKILNGTELIVPIKGLIDKNKELNKLNRDLVSINFKIDILIKKLKNINFIKKAPKNIVIQEQDKLNNYQQIKNRILKQQGIISNLNN